MSLDLKKKGFGIVKRRTEESRKFDFLSITRNLTDKSNITHDIWENLKAEYDELNSKDPVARTILSVLNSILHQERIVFAFTKDGLKDLVRDDKNISEQFRKGFKDSFYSAIRAKLYEYGFIKLVYEGEKSLNQPSAFEVIHPTFLDYLNRKVDKNEQLESTLSYCKGLSKKTNKNQLLKSREPQRELEKGTKEVRKKESKELNTSKNVSLDSSDKDKSKKLETSREFMDIIKSSNSQTVISRLKQFELQSIQYWIERLDECSSEHGFYPNESRIELLIKEFMK